MDNTLKEVWRDRAYGSVLTVLALPPDVEGCRLVPEELVGDVTPLLECLGVGVLCNGDVLKTGTLGELLLRLGDLLTFE